MPSQLSPPLRGECQCGAVGYTVSASPFVAYTCHCTQCQKLSSSAFITCMQCAAERVEIARGAPHERRRLAPSGNALTTWFCPACGSALFSQNSARPRIRTVYVGTLENPAGVDVAAHIWVKRKLPWVTLPGDHRVFDEAGDWTHDYASDLTRYKPK